MKWQGETISEKLRRKEKEGVYCWALLPVKMTDGTWVWLECYWRFEHSIVNRRVLSVDWQKGYDLMNPKRPPPPHGTRSVVKPTLVGTSLAGPVTRDTPK